MPDLWGWNTKRVGGWVKELNGTVRRSYTKGRGCTSVDMTSAWCNSCNPAASRGGPAKEDLSANHLSTMGVNSPPLQDRPRRVVQSLALFSDDCERIGSFFSFFLLHQAGELS